MIGKTSAAAVAALLSVNLLANSPVAAKECGAAQFGKLVDDTGAKLRDANAKSEAGMREKFEALARAKGWPAESAIERGFRFLNDDQTRTLDAQASELLIRLDLLGDTDSKPANCERYEELEEVADQLLEVTAAKRAHIAAKLAVALKPKLTARSAPTKSTQAKPADKKSTTANPSAFETSTRTARPAAGAWSTKTNTAPPPPPEVMASLPPVVVDKPNLTYGSHEIRAAGSGLFGTLSAELASVIKFAFDSYGKPNGYVLGTEGGAAFFAGLRYGSGDLVTKQHGKRKIYWQGPSIGTDFGLTGSRVMVLVYNLDDPRNIYDRFIGVEGAAYFVGGVGITFHQKGRLVLAPIRTGIGLRVGANVGYLKITPRQQLNPF